jgi:hypothetical protein
LNDELWQLETEGDAIAGVDCLVVRRARLLRRIDAWSAGGAARFATACNQRAAEVVGVNAGSISRGFIDDGRLAAAAGYFAVSAYCAALAVAQHGAGAGIERVYRQERTWQGYWIARELLAG